VLALDLIKLDLGQINTPGRHVDITKLLAGENNVLHRWQVPFDSR